ncbi:Lipase 3 [Armadillidium vulgare]|nr:Lipase 3 [Armadillidium vulgare]
MACIKMHLTLTLLFVIYNTLNGQEIKRPGFLSKSKWLGKLKSIYDYEDFTVPEIIQSFGYPAETHHVTTEDGYILGLHRIPYDEIGTYDDPAAIDYALSVTGQDQIYYVGFSMGTTVFFIMMSERPEYVDKIGRYEVASDPDDTNNDQTNKYCSEGNITAPICYIPLYLICGFDPLELNKELYPLLWLTTGARLSIL